ncbi:phage head morphogenesis protein [Gammaproteobacteria bacterium]|nr:phage head morphogenesis protein [Gammaproteobacteria bacterium]
MANITGRSRGKEQRHQEILVDRISQRYERAIAREISRAMNEAAKYVGEPSRLPEVRLNHAENMLKILTRLWTQSGQAASANLFRIAKSLGRMETKFVDITTPIVDAAIAQWIRAFGGEKITQITATTMADINAIVANGIQEGLSEREIGKAINLIAPTKSALRSQTIARTESHSSSQGISLSVAGESEIPMVKVWLASGGERTREAHNDANGQTVSLASPFIVDGEELDFPGDPNGSAENIINCRCAVGYEVA